MHYSIQNRNCNHNLQNSWAKIIRLYAFFNQFFSINGHGNLTESIPF